MTQPTAVPSPGRAAVGALRGGLAWSVAQPMALIVSGVFYAMVSGVLAAVWATATEANGGSIVGYSTAAVVWYVITTEAAIMSIPIRLVEEIGDDIGTERVAMEMLRPASVLLVRLSTEVGRMLPRLGLNVVIGAVLATIIVGPPPAAGTLGLGAVAIIIAVVINLVAQHAFASAAFWIRDAKATWFLYQRMLFILGGMLLPLEVLPDRLATVTKALPLMTMAYAPGRLVSGFDEPWLLAVQAGWLIALVALAVRLFAAGQERLVSGDA